MITDILRTEECLARYYEKKNKLGDKFADVDLTKLKEIKKWKYWILVENEFSYDKIAKKHHMLVPLRKFASEGEMLMFGEATEFAGIKKEIEKDYDSFLENTLHNRMLSKIYHLHCISYL